MDELSATIDLYLNQWRISITLIPIVIFVGAIVGLALYSIRKSEKYRENNDDGDYPDW